MSAKSGRKRAVRALTSLGAAMCVELLQRERDRDPDGIMWYLGGLIVVADKLRELGAHNFITEIRTDDVKLAFAARGLFVPERNRAVQDAPLRRGVIGLIEDVTDAVLLAH